MRKILILTCSIFLITITLHGQKRNVNPDPLRFENEITQINKLSFNESKNRIVFTGSSSIKMWRDIQDYYPTHQIINTGFGGSHMSDLLFYLEETVLRFKPSKVFIYEGDNDIFNKISRTKILKYAKHITARIIEKFPNCKIIFISPKPSVSRWVLKSNYQKLNHKLEIFASNNENIYFANVWDIMLDNSGIVRSDIFLEDNLHMNSAGYELWDRIIKKYLTNF